MRKRRLILIVFAAAIAIAVNTLVYTNVLNGSGTLLNLAKKLNFAYVTPQTYINLAKKLQRKPDYNHMIKQLDEAITDKSGEFIQAAFEGNDKDMKRLLDSSTQFIQSKDGSSFIRYIGEGTHVEGYMATDKKLLEAKERWHVLEKDNTVTCSMEIYLEDMKSPQLWYLHFRKVKDEWKVYMLENDI